MSNEIESIDMLVEAMRGSCGLYNQLVSENTKLRELESHDRAKIEYLKSDGQVDLKCTRKTFEADLLRAGADPLVVSLLMRHTLPGGLALTYGTYADPAALLNVKQQAVGRLDQWLRNQRAKAAVSGA